MDIEVGHYYQDGNGKVVKVLEHAQLKMHPQINREGHLDTNPENMITVEGFNCRDDEGNDFFALANGQLPQMWKDEKEQPVYSLPAYPSSYDLVKEVDPVEMDIQTERYEDSFQTAWRLESSLLLTLKVRAKNAESAYDQLPSIGEVEKVLGSLFSSAGIELEEVSYDHDEIEEEEGEE
jgi:hypothetical protein